jgi:hypothetical protein
VVAPAELEAALRAEPDDPCVAFPPTCGCERPPCGVEGLVCDGVDGELVRRGVVVVVVDGTVVAVVDGTVVVVVVEGVVVVVVVEVDVVEVSCR